jgi:hypothetical protein
VSTISVSSNDSNNRDGTTIAVPGDLTSRATAARRARAAANRSASCQACPSLNAAASRPSADGRSHLAPGTRAPRADAETPDRARSPRDRTEPSAGQNRCTSIAACVLEWRELARKSSECL